MDAATISAMTTREKAHELLDELPDAELDEVVRLLKVRRGEAEWETVPLPEGWSRMANGEPMPDVAAAVRRSREGH
jgi:hypothetical protein